MEVGEVGRRGMVDRNGDQCGGRRSMKEGVVGSNADQCGGRRSRKKGGGW